MNATLAIMYRHFVPRRIHVSSGNFCYQCIFMRARVCTLRSWCTRLDFMPESYLVTLTFSAEQCDKLILNQMVEDSKSHQKEKIVELFQEYRNPQPFHQQVAREGTISIVSTCNFALSISDM